MSPHILLLRRKSSQGSCSGWGQNRQKPWGWCVPGEGLAGPVFA